MAAGGTECRHSEKVKTYGMDSLENLCGNEKCYGPLGILIMLCISDFCEVKIHLEMEEKLE